MRFLHTIERWFKELFQNISLKKKLNLFSVAVLVPMAALMVFLIVNMNRYGAEYNRIVLNITTANEYSLQFKEDIDDTMYGLVIGSLDLSKIDEYKADSGSENITNPYTLIDQTEKVFSGLYGITTSDSNHTRIDYILKDLSSLRKRINEINDSVQGPSQQGKYEENMLKLERNIYILTEIIQDEIQEYVYYEASSLDAVRENISRELANAITIALVLFSGILITTVFLTRKIANSISYPLQELCKTTRLVGEGDFTMRARGSHGDEVSTLADSFNNMIKRIGNLVDDVKKEQLNLRVTELKLLQAQINPHFLYNTLDTIVWLAESGEKEKVTEMVTALSNFFRATLSKGQDFITIKEEESHVESYLQIQRLRYQDILEYEINIPAELYPYKIIKLTLQPIVENALYHGIKNKRGMGKITVSGQLVNGIIFLSVHDNGLGMKPDRLKAVRSLIDQDGGASVDPENGSGFGLANVNARIRLNYGPEYGLRIESTYGKETTVIAVIPAIIK